MDKLRRAVLSPTHNEKERTENVRVGIRLKPTKTTENSSPWVFEELPHTFPKIQLDPKYCERFKKPNFSQIYDLCFTGSDNFEVYSKCGRDIVLSAMEGYNGTLFAYGQTSSGKTYTMGTEEEPGIIPQAVDDIFKYIKRTGGSKEYLLRVSYIEIYNETIKDLLSPEMGDLRVHEDKIRGVYVAPLKEEIVTTPKQVMKIIDRGEANRHIASNDYHEHSSRSHTLFQILIECRDDSHSKLSLNKRHVLGFHKKQQGGVKFSQLNLIDLAGSEKNSTDGERRKEAAFINKSLLTLGSVISKIADGKVGHIPYRDSKLTRVLQSALSGNSRIGVICTINSAGTYVEESLSTLKFGARIKTITIKAQKNPIKDGKALIQKYQSEINDLKIKLVDTNTTIEKSQSEELEQLRQKNQQYEGELLELNLARTAYKERIDHLTKLILTSTSMEDKVFKRSRPLSVHISQKEKGFFSQRLSFMGKQKDRNERLDWVLEDLKFKNRYIQALETLLDSLDNESGIYEDPTVIYKKYQNILNNKNAWEEDNHSQSQQQAKAIEEKVSTTLGRVASLRLSRQFSRTESDILSTLNLPRTLPFDPTRESSQRGSEKSPSNDSFYTPINQDEINETNNKSEIVEMEEIIEDQNRVILELEQERKVQSKQVTDLKDKVKRLELLLFKKAEIEAASNNLKSDETTFAQRRVTELEQALEQEREWRKKYLLLNSKDAMEGLESLSLNEDALKSSSPIPPPRLRPPNTLRTESPSSTY
ncbi:kinesin-domain-containing protein [Neoconidiobolus thromboides FSU 785]|nr:kinesin-domain-containing protein [Neoconidiobolus thromboides FSU 785]